METSESDKTMGSLYMLDLDGQGIYYPFAVKKYGDERASMLDMYCVKVNGQFLTLDQWHARTNITRSTIRKRLQNGWPMLDAVNTAGSNWRVAPGSEEPLVPTMGRPAQLYELDGEKRTLNDWCAS